MPALSSYDLFRCRVEHRRINSFGEPWATLRTWTIAWAMDSQTNSNKVLFSLSWENWSLFPSVYVKVPSLSPAFSFFYLRFFSIIIMSTWPRNFARISRGGTVFSELIMASQWFLQHNGPLRANCLLPTHVWRAAADSVATNIFMQLFRRSLFNNLLTLIALNCWPSLSPWNYGVCGGPVYV